LDDEGFIWSQIFLGQAVGEHSFQSGLEVDTPDHDGFCRRNFHEVGIWRGSFMDECDETALNNTKM
jgi:hypothetical protein